jgi:hypothetical protein
VNDLDQFRETQRRLIERAVGKHALVLGMHFPPFPCLGHVVETEQGRQWQPVETGE